MTTALTTRGPDELPHYAILNSGYGQVSYGMPQPASYLQGISERSQKLECMFVN
jgi:hypothetical protein